MKILVVLFVSASTYLAAGDASGYWQGAINLPNAELKIAVELQTGDGWSGAIDIPMQGIRGHELSGIQAEDGRVRFKMAGVPGEPSFEGELSEAGDAISGAFSQGPQSFPFALERSEKPPKDADATAAIQPLPGEGAPGVWQGTLEAGPSKLRLAVHITGENGALRAEFNSIDQGAKLDADRVVYESRELTFEIARIQGSFTGGMNADGSALEGTWTQMDHSFPLTLYRTE